MLHATSQHQHHPHDCWETRQAPHSWDRSLLIRILTPTPYISTHEMATPTHSACIAFSSLANSCLSAEDLAKTAFQLARLSYSKLSVSKFFILPTCMFAISIAVLLQDRYCLTCQCLPGRDPSMVCARPQQSTPSLMTTSENYTQLTCSHSTPRKMQERTNKHNKRTCTMPQHIKFEQAARVLRNS